MQTNFVDLKITFDISSLICRIRSLVVEEGYKKFTDLVQTLQHVYLFSLLDKHYYLQSTSHDLRLMIVTYINYLEEEFTKDTYKI